MTATTLLGNIFAHVRCAALLCLNHATVGLRLRHMNGVWLGYRNGIRSRYWYWHSNWTRNSFGLAVCNDNTLLCSVTTIIGRDIYVVNVSWGYVCWCMNRVIVVNDRFASFFCFAIPTSRYMCIMTIVVRYSFNTFISSFIEAMWAIKLIVVRRDFIDARVTVRLFWTNRTLILYLYLICNSNPTSVTTFLGVWRTLEINFGHSAIEWYSVYATAKVVFVCTLKVIKNFIWRWCIFFIKTLNKSNYLVGILQWPLE